MAGTDSTRDFAHDPAAPAVVLVEPQLPENIGGVARAMMNFGLYDLRMVRPRKWPHAKAYAMASGADAVLDAAKLFESTEEAIADIHHVFATTARLRDMEKPVVAPREAAARTHGAAAAAERTAILFGCERTGLENDDIAIAEAVIMVPANPAHASLNLAQATLLIGYEWFLATGVAPPAQLNRRAGQPATAREMQGLYEHLEAMLDDTGFLRVSDKRPRMVRNIRSIFARAALTDQEVRTLRGMLTSFAHPRRPGAAARVDDADDGAC